MKIHGVTTEEKFDIAVFVFTFNHVDFITNCLDSIMIQKTRANWHLFVHDDASTDGTRNILKEFYNRYPNRITLILQEENQFQKGRPIGIDLFKNSHSDFIAFCEGDDFWTHEKKISYQYKFMKKNDWCSLLHSPVTVLNTDGWGEYEKNLTKILKNKKFKKKRISGALLTDGNFIMTCATLIRRCELPEHLLESIEKLQPLDYILFSLATRHRDIGFQNKKMSTYRLHANNYFASESKQVIEADYEKTREFLNSNSPHKFVH
jgi:glycosyltransferase involved in cell wall biosynthesis